MGQTGPVIGHLGLNVVHLDASRAYYAALMPLLGFEPFLDDPDQFAYRPAGGKPGTYLFFYPADPDADGAGAGPYAATKAGLQHLAFMVPTRTRVREVRDLALELGSTIRHEPQEWPEYPPPYHAVFWFDPNGFILEAVCHHDRD